MRCVLMSEEARKKNVFERGPNPPARGTVVNIYLSIFAGRTMALASLIQCAPAPPDITLLGTDHDFGPMFFQGGYIESCTAPYTWTASCLEMEEF